MGNYCPNYFHVEGKDSRSDWADRKTHNCLFLSCSGSFGKNSKTILTSESFEIIT